MSQVKKFRVLQSIILADGSRYGKGDTYEYTSDNQVITLALIKECADVFEEIVKKEEEKPLVVNLDNINRLEVIHQELGRIHVEYNITAIDVQEQDNGKTLKIFIKK